MTIEEHIAKLRSQVKALDGNKPFAIAVQSVHALRVKRIFDTGISGAAYNKSKPLYVSDKNLRSNGNHRGKTGKPIKTTYFKSYYDLKAAQGFNANVVNLRLTNDLQSDFANAQLTSGTGAPPAGIAIKVNDNLFIEAIRRPKNVKKLNGLVKRYGNFTLFTTEERAAFNKVLTFEFNKLMK